MTHDFNVEVQQHRRLSERIGARARSVSDAFFETGGLTEIWRLIEYIGHTDNQEALVTRGNFSGKKAKYVPLLQGRGWEGGSRG